jgi:hypothetical protein
MMTTIMLRDIPDELMEEIKLAAAIERRSVPAEILFLTEAGVRKILLTQREHAETLARLRHELASRPKFPVSSTELIDEDRQR